VQSSMECGQYCRQRQKCVGFNFKSSKTKSDQMNCQLTNSKRYSNSEPGVSGTEAAWSFYQVLQIKVIFLVVSISSLYRSCNLSEVHIEKE
jgi:hypothetical protein